MTRNNEGNGIPHWCKENASISVYDALPARIRKAMRESSFDYANAAIRDYYHKFGEEATVAWLVGGDKINVRRAALAVYGPDHPQAQ